MADVSPEATTAVGIQELGLFNAESLFVRFDFTKEALFASSERYAATLRADKPIEMPPEIKTYVHELTHYLHYTTTPYGLFLQYSRLVQSEATTMIVRALLNAGIAFRMPLLENVPPLTGEIAKTVNWGLALWLNVENLLAMLHGDTESRIAVIERSAVGNLPPLLPLHDAFAGVQDTMADVLEEWNKSARVTANNPVPMYQAGFDHEAIDEEWSKAPTDMNDAVARQQDALDLAGFPFGVEAIIESAATAAEFCPSNIGYDAFKVWANEKVDPKLQVYRRCIADALDAIPTRDLMEFIHSYMALCELTLYAPLLPHHVHLRRQSPSFAQILPIHRWMDVVRAAAHVEPMREIGDHARYITEICRYVGMTHPIKIIEAALEGPDVVSDPLGQMFLWAQQWRAQDSVGFIGVNRFLFGTEPLAALWKARFNFAVVDFSDRTNYHPNKTFLKAIVTRHLNLLAMRCIMLGRSLTILAPYRGTPEQRHIMTEWLQNHFRAVFGREFPMLQVVA